MPSTRNGAPQGLSGTKAVLGALAALAIVGAVGGGLWVWPRLFPNPVARGQSAYERGDYDEAAALARAAMRQDRGDPTALRLLARASTRLGRDETARRLFRAMAPELFEAEDYYLLSVLMRRDGDDGMAQSALENAENRDPKHVETVLAMGDLYRRYRMFETAVAYGTRAAALPGGEARGLALLGLAQTDLHDLPGAADSLSRALQADPLLTGATLSAAEARLLLARVFLGLGEGAKAEQVLTEIGEPTPEVDWLRTRALLQQGKSQESTAAHSIGASPASDPMAPEPAPFVGSAQCMECHTEIHSAQQASRHGRTFARAPALHDVPLPDRPLPDPHNPSVQHSISREADKLIVRTKLDDQVRQAVVAYMVGSGDKGVTLLGVEPDGTTRELRLSHYPQEGWDRTTGQDETPDTPDGYLGRPLAADAQRRCLTCHTTDFRAAASGEGPASHDRAIGCEKCHGPGGNHLLAMERGFAEPAIARPRLASAEQTIGLCGQCHRPLNNGEPPPEDPASVRFQAASLVRSACYTKSPGSFDCVTCHDPHHDANTDRAFYERICLACHASPGEVLPPVQTGSRRPVDPATLLEPSRRVPCPVNPRSGCVDCHMPSSRSVMLHSSFTDHHIRVYRPNQNQDVDD